MIPLGAILDAAAHLFQAVAEGHVALQAVAREPFDRHLAAGDRRGGEEVAGGRGVGLDRVVAALIALARRESRNRRRLVVLDT